MREPNPRQSDAAAVLEMPAATEQRDANSPSQLTRYFARNRLALGILAVLLLLTAALAMHWFYPRALQLYTPLAADESLIIGSAVYLDDAKVGIVADIPSQEGIRFADLRLAGLSSAQRGKLKEGVVRVSGYRIAWLTTEHVNKKGPPLIDGDTVPTINRADMESRRVVASLWSWIIPGGGAGLLWLLWRQTKRMLF